VSVFDLHCRRAIVTGAARGIGAAIVRALARSGVRVAIADLDLPAAQALAS
jgi:NAD(P)-dependent dehydrogenase (short-subunit alcohol dehydrogenase family)